MLLATLGHWTSVWVDFAVWDTAKKNLHIWQLSFQSSASRMTWELSLCHKSFQLFFSNNSPGKYPRRWPWISSQLRSLAALYEVKAIYNPPSVTRRRLLSPRLMFHDLSLLLSEQTFVKGYNSDLRLIKLHGFFFFIYYRHHQLLNKLLWSLYHSVSLIFPIPSS